MNERMGVSVCYADPHGHFLSPLQVAPGTTIGAAIALSGVLQAHPDIDLATQSVGIFSKKKSLETVLHEGDRVEIYRPLVADPKDARRKRAARKPGVRV
jgi:uncharacterized protein